MLALEQIIFQILYIFSITALGSFFTRKINISNQNKFFLSFLIGAIIIVAYIFILSESMLVYSKYLLALLVFLGASSLMNLKSTLHNWCAVFSDLNTHLFKDDRWRPCFIASFFLLIIFLLLISTTPPRAADALAYHLTQPKFILQDHGYLFYPYMRFHFPLYFEMLFLPGLSIFNGVSIKIAVFLTFLLGIICLIRIAAFYKIKHTRFLFFMIFFTPLCFHEAHIAVNDWPVILFCLIGFLFLFQLEKTNHIVFLYASLASLGFALGIKYQTIFLFPWALIIAIKYLTNERPSKIFYMHSAFACIIMLAIACPFYIKNYIYFHNPVWPAGLKFFKSPHNYLQTVALQYSQSNTGTHSLMSLWTNIKSIMLYPLIPASIWLGILIAALCDFKNQRYEVLGLISFFIAWWLLQPVYYIRFSIYALPLGLIIFFTWLNKKSLACFSVRGAASFIYGITLTLTIPLFFYYAYFYVSFLINKNLTTYHQYTWYYPDTTWVNIHTPANSHVLAILLSGQTYYLNRHYVRADELSGAINWKKITTNKQLYQFLIKNKFDYILLGSNNKIIDKFMRSSFASILYKHDTKLYSSRLGKKFTIQPTYIIKVIKSHHTAV